MWPKWRRWIKLMIQTINKLHIVMLSWFLYCYHTTGGPCLTLGYHQMVLSLGLLPWFMNGVAHPINDQRERTILAVQSTKFLYCNINAAEKGTGVLKCAPTLELMSGSIHENIISHNWYLTTKIQGSTIHPQHYWSFFTWPLGLSLSPTNHPRTFLCLVPNSGFSTDGPHLASIVIKTILAVRLAASK